MARAAAILGFEGTALTEWEKAFFREVDPWGFIVFKRNLETAEQIRALTAEVRETVGWNAPVLVDQEGGRVQRIGPPDWTSYPPGATYGALYAQDAALGLEAAETGARLIAHDLHALGIDTDCLPILDVRSPKMHEVIGDRAYGGTPESVAAIGRAVATGLARGGVLSIAKHVPGHGRATVDSHFSLPSVDTVRAELEAVDFPPFRALNDLPMGMTAHVVYTDIDADAPATTSKKVIDEVIRGSIGFDGLLMTDDLSMKALGGTFEDRTRRSLDAGCDIILHCNGDRSEMEAVANACGRLEGKAAERAERAIAARAAPDEADIPALRARFDGVLAQFAAA